MRMNWFKRYDGGFASLLSLVAAIAIICIIGYITFRVYFKSSSPEEIEKSLSEQGIDTSSYQSILDSSRKKVEDINRQLLERTRQTEDLR